MSLKRRQQGSMLISVLFIMIILAGLMAAMSTLSNQSSQQLVYEAQALKARLAAEAVLEQQIYAQLKDIDAEAVYKKNNALQLDDCEAYVADLKPFTGTQRTQVNIIATGECSTGQLTVTRNIEVEVIDNEN